MMPRADVIGGAAPPVRRRWADFLALNQLLERDVDALVYLPVLFVLMAVDKVAF